VLIEGRNRELRKMFEEIGHFVEKIRRVGYGPLALDQEPGQFRELGPEELVRLRQAAEGKWRPKTRAAGRHEVVELPTVRPKPTRPRPAFEGRAPGAAGPRLYPPKKPFVPSDDREQARPYRAARPGRDSGPGRGRVGGAGKTFGTRKPAAGVFQPRTDEAGKKSPAKFGAGRPAWKKEDRGARPPASFRPAEGRGDRTAAYRGGQSASRPAPGGQRSSDRDRSGAGRSDGQRAFGARPAWSKRDAGNRPQGNRPRFDQGSSGARAGSRSGFESPGSAPSRRSQFRPADSQGDRPRFERTAGARPGARPGNSSARPYSGSKPRSDGRSGGRPAGTSGFKPNLSYGATGRPASNTGKRPPSKNRSTGGRSGPRPGPNRSGGRGGKRY
jgi:23S rRNA pseudouridine2605 synthase